MSIPLEKLEIEALKLPMEERAFLADRLLHSLGGKVLTDVDEAWIKVAERRYGEYNAGKREGIPASEVFAEADRILK